MRKLHQFLFITGLSLSLTACFHPDIHQGNEYDTAMSSQLKIGMSKDKVMEIMGDPVMTEPFTENEMTYVDYFYPNRGKTTKKNIVLRFKNNKLVDIKEAPAAAPKAEKSPSALVPFPPVHERSGNVRADDKPEIVIK
jgi:outer membrane protein assembly factor BamE